MKLKTFSILAILLVACFAVFYSCRKIDSPENAQVSSTLLKNAREWYNIQINGPRVFTNSKKNTLKLKWDSAYTDVDDKGKKHLIVPTVEYPLESKRVKASRFIIFDDEGGEITNGNVVEIFERNDGTPKKTERINAKYNDDKIGHFTGVIIKYNINYIRISGSAYSYGRRLKGDVQLSRYVSTKSKSSGKTAVISCQQYDVYWVWRYADTQEVIASEYLYSYNSCSTTGDPYGNESGNTGGGNGTPQPINESPTSVINKDSLLMKFPCAVREVLEKLESSSDYWAMTFPFRTPGVLALTWNSQSQVWNNAGIYSLGTTLNFGPGNMSAAININSSLLTHGSKLAIATAMIHETVHAYARWYVKNSLIQLYTLQEMDETNDYGMWIWMARETRLMDDLDPNYVEHYFMLNMFDSMVQILKTFDNANHTDAEYRGMMLFGMKTVGTVGSTQTPLSTARQQALEAQYNAIATKYGLTDASINTVHNKNLAQATAPEKLTNPCPPAP